MARTIPRTGMQNNRFLFRPPLSSAPPPQTPPFRMYRSCNGAAGFATSGWPFFIRDLILADTLPVVLLHTGGVIGSRKRKIIRQFAIVCQASQQPTCSCTHPFRRFPVTCLPAVAPSCRRALGKTDDGLAMQKENVTAGVPGMGNVSRGSNAGNFCILFPFREPHHMHNGLSVRSNPA